MLEKGHFEVLSIMLSVLITLHHFNRRRLQQMRDEIHKLTKMAIEHEILIDMYCELTGRKRSDLPTRHIDGSFRY